MSNPISTNEDIEFRMVEFYIKFCEFQKIISEQGILNKENTTINKEIIIADYYNLIITNMNELVIPYMKIISDRLESIFEYLLLQSNYSINCLLKNNLSPLDFLENIFCDKLYNVLFNSLNKNKIIASNDEKMLHYILIRIECLKYLKYIQLINCDKLILYQNQFKSNMVQTLVPTSELTLTEISINQKKQVQKKKNHEPKLNYIFICFINNRIKELKIRINMIYNNLINNFPEFTESIQMSDYILNLVFVK